MSILKHVIVWRQRKRLMRQVDALMHARRSVVRDMKAARSRGGSIRIVYRQATDIGGGTAS